MTREEPVQGRKEEGVENEENERYRFQDSVQMRHPRLSFARLKSGAYCDPVVNLGWESWCDRARLDNPAPRPAGETAKPSGEGETPEGRDRPVDSRAVSPSPVTIGTRESGSDAPGDETGPRPSRISGKPCGEDALREAFTVATLERIKWERQTGIAYRAVNDGFGRIRDRSKIPLHTLACAKQNEARRECDRAYDALAAATGKARPS